MIALNPAHIVETVAAEHGLTVDALMRRDQHEPVPRVRREAMRALLDAGLHASAVARIFTMSEASVRYATRTRTLAQDGPLPRAGTARQPSASSGAGERPSRESAVPVASDGR